MESAKAKAKRAERAGRQTRVMEKKGLSKASGMQDSYSL